MVNVHDLTVNVSIFAIRTKNTDAAKEIPKGKICEQVGTVLY